MTVTTPASSPVHYRPSAVWSLYVGLLLSAVALVFPFIDRVSTGILAEHIRHGYPDAGADQIDVGVNFYLIILSVVGGIGLLCWSLMIWATRTGRRSARWVAPVILVGAAAIALSGLLITDTSGEVGLAPLLGWLLMLPCVAGVVAVVQLWRR